MANSHYTTLNNYEANALKELKIWQHRMVQKPSYFNKLTAKLQYKINKLIPEKVHQAITTTIKQMIRAVLFGAERTTSTFAKSGGLEECEAIVQERINFYKNTAAAEGGITGAGGILLGLADFPLLLSIKLKLLFDIAAIYGYSVKDYRERLYILYIFQLAFSSQENRSEVYRQVLRWDEDYKHLPDDIHQFDWRTFQQQYRDYIDLAKMAQLVPIIGAPVGVVVNYRLIRRLGITAKNAYRMRWWAESRRIEKA